MTCDVLVTGFGPFPHVRINPTAALARVVARRIGGTARVLETSYGRGLGDLADALATLRPGAVLMLGLAARTRQVRVETCARPGASPLAVDVTGKLPVKRPSPRRNALPTLSMLPRRATASPGQALATLRRHGVPARLSASAGRYLCNAAYRLALDQARGIPVLFIHVPAARAPAGSMPRGRVVNRRPSAATLGAALAGIARGLHIAARRRMF